MKLPPAKGPSKPVLDQSITLKPTPITQENLDLPIDLGWVTQEVVCAGVEEADAPAACQ